MNTTVRSYETLYIVDATLTDDQVQPIIDRYSQVVRDQGGQVQAAGRWDKRRLAYEVAGRREGIYILMYFTGEPAVARELDRVFRIADDVFRHLIVRVEPQHVDMSRIEQPQPSAESAEAAGVEEAEAEQEALTEPEAHVEEEPVEAQVEESCETAPEEPAGEPEPSAAEQSEEIGDQEPNSEGE